MHQKNFDFFILGTGPAGNTLATRASKAGYTVGICDPLPYGGACPNRGCDPKKVLYAAARAMASTQRLAGKGFTKLPEVSWPDLMRWKSTFTKHIPEATREDFKELGIDCLEGEARFVGPGKLIVGEAQITADHVVIATGASPAPLDIPGKEHFLDSAGFLEMDDLPERLLIIGSGYIGSSFAQISAILGSEVIVVASEENPVDAFDEDLNSLVVESAEAYGITFHFNTKVTSIHKTDGGQFRVTCEAEDGPDHTELVDRVIHCAGRVPNVKDIGLEAAGIEFDGKGIKVNDRCHTSVDQHYAIGDCTNSGLPLTPVATHEARLLAENLFKGLNRKIDYLPIPTVAFTIPPITAVGMTAQQASDDDRNLKIKFENTTHWFTNHHVNAQVAAYKLVIDEEKDLIPGAHILGEGADEMINVFALAIHQGITITELKHQLYAYPTAISDIKEMLS